MASSCSNSKIRSTVNSVHHTHTQCYIIFVVLNQIETIHRKASLAQRSRKVDSVANRSW